MIIGIGGGYVFSYGEISGLQSEITALATEYDSLNVTCNQLATNYSSLEAMYSQLQMTCGNLNVTYHQLLSDCNFLQSQYSQLQSNHDSLNSSYYGLQEAYGLLDENYNSLNLAYSELQGIYEEAVDRIAELEQMLEYEVYALLDQEYYHSVKSDLQNANETILVAMYSMIYDPDDTSDWANDLIRELVYAKDRGVNVTVIIEYRTYWGYMNDNLEAYDYLLATGVTVQLDEDTETDHLKLVVIDDSIVYVGSHNWSESGLYYNRETSVKIVSEDIAEGFKAYFGTI